MTEKFIYEDEVVSFLDSWKNGVVSIGQTYIENNDFVSAAKDFISTHYNFTCLLYTSPSPRDRQKSRMPSSA